MKIIDMTCPRCGASMKPGADKKSAACEYCGHHMIIVQEKTAKETYARTETVKKKKVSGGKIALIVIGIIVLIQVAAAMAGNLVKPQVNPFDCIDVSFRGSDGKGEIVVDLKNASGIDLNRIDFDISKEDRLYQGETISIYASSEDYRLLEKEKNYIVEGLDEYLKNLEDIPEDILEIIHVKAEAGLDLNLDRSKKMGVFQSLKPVKLFLQTDGKQTNHLYDVFEATFMTSGGEKICYVMVCFNDVIMGKGEKTYINMSGGMFQGKITQVEGSLWITAYDSLEEIRAELLSNRESYMDLKELDLNL